MKLDARIWTRVVELFARMSALDPGPRARVLAEVDPDPEVRAWLDRLLRAQDSADEALIDRTVYKVLEARAGRAPAVAAGTLPERLGPWRLLQEIGRGGTGRVVLAERADGRDQQQVAVKLLAGRALKPEHSAALEREIRLLAQLEHPGIVRLIDGGVERLGGTLGNDWEDYCSDEGQPYLVMEYVKGDPIDLWCLKHGATLDQRMALIRQVANAVAHAHRRLVVHTDIKPANVLVTEQGRVRLLDFGVGALLRNPVDQDRLATPCSPAWCAPEQLHGAVPDVTQDIYALGALMLRLLTGHRIRDGRQVTRWLAGLPDSPESPQAPSQHLLPGLPVKRVRGDLDAICQRALAHAPDHRYQSVETLDADLERWRGDRPVATRPLSPPARLGRWIRRHWMPVTAAGVAVVALTAGMIAARQGADMARASAERALAQAQRAVSVRDLVLDLFRAADPLRAGGAELSTRQVLSGAGEALSSNPELTPDIRLEVLNAVADVQRTLGWIDDAERVLDTARTLIASGHALAPETRAETWLQKAMLENHQRDFDAAQDWLDRAQHELEGRRGDAADRVMARTLALQGSIHARLNRHADATAALDEADRLLFALDPRMPEAELVVASARGVTAFYREQYDQALRHMQKTLDLQRELGNEHEVATIVTLGNMAAIAAEMGRMDDALAWDRDAVATARDALPDGHAQLGQALYSLGDTLRQMGRYSEALDALGEAAEIQQTAGLDGEFQRVQLTRARTLFAVGDYPGALAAASAIRRPLAERLGNGSREALLSLEVELASRALMGENPIPSLRREIQRQFEALPQDQRASSIADLLRWRLADIELQYGRPGQVETWLEFARRDAPEPEHASVLLRWLGVRIRRDLAQGETPSPDLEQRLMTALDLNGSNIDARAYAWCVLAESAMARNAQEQLREASQVLEGITRERSLSDEMARTVMNMRQNMMGG